MALDIPGAASTSEGPLDAVNSDGADEGPPTISHYGSGSEPLEPLSDEESETDTLRQKNPLGYTITQPTEDEIDKLDDVGEAAKKPA